MDRATRDRLRAVAKEILAANDRGGYTVPTGGLYPFQWNWDSCLVALGWAAFDEVRAWHEIETLFSAQWHDGMLPHIVFHRPDPGYFPGPKVWRTGRTPATSGITSRRWRQAACAGCLRAQPIERVRRRLPNACSRSFSPFSAGFTASATRRASASSPRSIPGRRAWTTARPGTRRSPRIGVAADLEPYVRRDTQHVAAAERPTSAEYDRYMTLVQLYRAHGYGPGIVEIAPFRVADVATNCILLRADRDLLWLADRLGVDAPCEEISRWIGRAEAAFAGFRDPATGLWHSYDLCADAPVPTATHAGFLAFWAGLGDEVLAERLEAWLAGARYGLASVRADDPRFERRRYWRGPVWAITNFLIGEGLAASGFEELATRLRNDTVALIAEHGFFEYFDPLDGRGCGGDRFSWTAAMWLAWADPEAESWSAKSTAPA